MWFENTTDESLTIACHGPNGEDPLVLTLDPGEEEFVHPATSRVEVR